MPRPVLSGFAATRRSHSAPNGWSPKRVLLNVRTTSGWKPAKAWLTMSHSAHRFTWVIARAIASSPKTDGSVRAATRLATASNRLRSQTAGLYNIHTLPSPIVILLLLAVQSRPSLLTVDLGLCFGRAIGFWPLTHSVQHHFFQSCARMCRH